MRNGWQVYIGNGEAKLLDLYDKQSPSERLGYGLGRTSTTIYHTTVSVVY